MLSGIEISIFFVSDHLNALKRLCFHIKLDTRKILANSFIISNFNYCPLVWDFSTAKQLQKIEKTQERVLRFLHDDCVRLFDAIKS